MAGCLWVHALPVKGIESTAKEQHYGQRKAA